MQLNSVVFHRYLKKIHGALCGAIERRNISIKLLTSWTESTDDEEQFLNSFQRYAQEVTGKKFKLVSKNHFAPCKRCLVVSHFPYSFISEKNFLSQMAY